ncbi:MAG: energy transducer TonB [Flavobacteriales bacterium]
MKTTFIILLGLSLTACRTLPVLVPDDEVHEREVFTDPLEDAEFPGGYQKLQAYIKDNIDLSTILNSATEPLVNVHVIVRFDIEKDGSIRNAIIEKETNKCLACQKEALRLVENMPPWTPAMLDGKPQMTSARIPIDFIFEPFVEAEFPGGLDAQLKYINENFNSRVQGCGDFEKRDERIVVSFVIEKDGSITNIEIEKASASCPPCNAEVLRIVKAMPNWKPAQNAGLNVRSSVRLPIILNF